MKMAFQKVSIRNVEITSAFWSQMQRCSKDITIPAIIKAQKSLKHWYCLTWKEGHEVQPHVCEFRFSQANKSMPANVLAPAFLGQRYLQNCRSRLLLFDEE